MFTPGTSMPDVGDVGDVGEVEDQAQRPDTPVGSRQGAPSPDSPGWSAVLRTTLGGCPIVCAPP
jgi:hypothetical protein